MMKTILTVLFFVVLTSLNLCDAQTPPAQAPTDAPSVPVSPQTSNPPTRVAQPPVVQSPPANIQPQAVATSPTTSPPVITTPPADIGSLIAKEVLSANNQVVSQVASMYQNLGLFITIIVTLVGGFTTWMSYIARKSVQEFIQEWTEKVKSLESEWTEKVKFLESDMKEGLKRLRDAIAEAEGSAKEAAKHAQAIEDNKKIVDKILQDYDRLRSIPTLSAQLRGDEQVGVSPQPIEETALAQPPQESPTTEEDAEVADRLKGKFDPPEDKG